MKTIKKKKKTNQHYIDNKRFNELLIEFIDKDNRSVFEELGSIFIKLAENILHRPNFINYTNDRKDDMTSDATYHMVKYIKGYKTSMRNPFAFFSQIAFNAFKQNINKANKHRDIFVPLTFIENMSRESGNKIYD